jgi:purine-binding chemotaxis protein CheW
MSDESASTADQYLTFTLGEEQYAVEVGKVREVLEFTEITRVPRTREYMKGVINLRGSVVPVVDLRRKFGLAEADATVDTSIVVMELDLGDEAVIVGTVADSVQEVVSIDEGQIEPSPKIGTRIEGEFIKGIGKQDDRFIIILDMDRVFSEAELSNVAAEQGES